MTRKKFFLIFCFLIIDIILIVGFLVIRDATSFNELKKEVYSLSKLDLTKDRYNRRIKSNGEYAIVERTIKEYLDGCAVDVQYLSSMMNDSTLSNILSYDNYQKDGPEFTKSIEYLEKSKKEYNEKIDSLLSNMDEEYIYSLINKKINDPYYISLYRELILDDNIMDDINEVKGVLEDTRKKMNVIYDSSIEVLKYLKENKDNWKLEDNEIKFQTQGMYDHYMSIINKVKPSEEKSL